MSFPNRGEGGGPPLGKNSHIFPFFFWQRPIAKCIFYRKDSLKSPKSRFRLNHPEYRLQSLVSSEKEKYWHALTSDCYQLFIFQRRGEYGEGFLSLCPPGTRLCWCLQQIWRWSKWKIVFIKKIPRRDGKIQEVATEVWRNRSNQVNFYSLRSIDNGNVNPFVYDFKIATRDRMWDILVILAAV